MDVLTLAPVTHPVRSGALLRRLAIASLVANIGIVVTGGIVRLTSSGMGCPTWPRCTEDSYVSHPELGIHGAIEFGNRLLTFVLVLIAVATFVAAMRDRRRGLDRPDVVLLAAVMALGIPAQAILGGITVWTHLNPFVVALHFLLSMVLIGLGVRLVRRTRGLRPQPVPRRSVLLARTAFGLMVLTVWLGTVVTGSGPHAGDIDARRTGLDPALVSHVHAWAVYATVAATLACVVLIGNRAAIVLLVVEVAQGAVGFIQYHSGLPVAVVALHLLGAAAAVALATNLLLSVRAPADPT